jgi:hypothetical protein
MLHPAGIISKWLHVRKPTHKGHASQARTTSGQATLLLPDYAPPA